MFRQVALILLLIYIASAVPSPKHKHGKPHPKHKPGHKGKGGHDHHHDHGHNHGHGHGHDHHDDKPAIHCEWDEWTIGECSKKCGYGTRTNTRTKKVVEKYGGTCTGPSTETETCKLKECPVHCEWKDWNIGTCSKTCGGGERTNTRDKKVSAKHGGSKCKGVSSITESCNVQECPDTCSAFSNYVKTCDDRKFAKGGHCVLLVKTSGGNCKTYCEGQGAQCIRAMDNTGNTCTRNVNGHGRQTRRERGCLQNWNNQICVCGTPRKATTGLKKKIVCEHKSMKIKCGPNESIKIKKVRYGRRSKKICPHKADYNLRCSSKGALGIARETCQDKQSCYLKAKNSVFGDPCVGTFKYLTVKYKCEPNRYN